MKWFAKELGYTDEQEYWGIVGLLHDIDFELYPEMHCIKAPELLKEAGVSDDIIHAVWLSAKIGASLLAVMRRCLVLIHVTPGWKRSPTLKS